ncbi:MAG TPA: EutN/CcmL family microcompartment protein [Bryobacteraceae bacterium]|nr:EutN/CcmL family microcompartment protein [Bryobacteraceae bacterium]
MQLGRVIGRVWATAKSESLSGHALKIVQPVTPELQAAGRSIVCTDWASAATGDIVYWSRAKEGAFAFTPGEVCTDATIVGIVDVMRVKR